MTSYSELAFINIVKHSINTLYSLYVIFATLYISIRLNCKIIEGEIRDRITKNINALKIDVEHKKDNIDKYKYKFNDILKPFKKKYIKKSMLVFLIYLSFQSLFWIILIISNNEGTLNLIELDVLFYILFINVLANIGYIMTKIILFIIQYKKLRDYPIIILKEMAEETTDAVIQTDPG